jgi:NAD(P)-dependent dehydrogenase (short-subunit alcohol dehydrogenase family)
MTKPLTDRIALVTGASRGIGAALALELAQAGAHVVAVARTVGGLEELDDKIKAAGGSATLVPLDMKDTDGIARLAAALKERYGRLDVAGRPHRAEAVGQHDGGQRRRQLASHPGLR